jgi:Phosphotransferase enzyme family
MEGLGQQRELVRAALRTALGPAADGADFHPAFAVLASPGWHGVDGLHWRATVAGRPCHVKAMHADAGGYVDVACAFRAAQAASDVGVGPEVLAADADTGALVMADVSATHRTGTLDRLHPDVVVGSVIAAKQAFQRGSSLGRPTDAFAEVLRFADAARAAGASLPTDMAWLLASVAEAGAAIAACGRDSVPAHGDGNASNVLIAEDGSALLVDWDRAGDMDPFEDLGSLLAELAPQEPEARAIFERWHGRVDDGLLARATLYGVADDLRWGLIAATLAATSPRTSLEFLKFAGWRFLRCRMAVRDPRFPERVRTVR